MRRFILLFLAVTVFLWATPGFPLDQDGRKTSFLCLNEENKPKLLESPLRPSNDNVFKQIRKWRKKIKKSGRRRPKLPIWIVYESIVESLRNKLTYDEYELNVRLLKLKANIEEASKYCISKNSQTHQNDFQCPLPTDISHNGKCFRGIIHKLDNVTYDVASKFCSKIGWKLANIYDGTHYVKIAKYLRNEFTTAEALDTTAWLGMSHDHRMQTLRYSSGEPATKVEMALVPINLSVNVSFAKMAIHIHRLSSEDSYVHDSPRDNAVGNGALCEYPLE
ncbi:uncharacterized protein LOC120342566 [Styela clava]